MNYIYSVTNRNYSVVRGILMLIFGVCLLMWPGSTVGLIIKIIAAFFLAAGLLTLIIALNVNVKDGSGVPFLSIVNICVYLILGLLIFLFPGFFLGLIAFLFGAVLLFAGIGQLVNLYQSSKYGPVSGGLYIIPVLIVLAGIALFFSPGSSTAFITMVFGVSIALSGISEIISGIKLKGVKSRKSGKGRGPVEDARYEEIKDNK